MGKFLTYGILQCMHLHFEMIFLFGLVGFNSNQFLMFIEDDIMYFSAGIEWSLDNDASNAAVLVASEAHSITLAVEGLLGVVFTVATLTDEAVEVGEVVLCIVFIYFTFHSLYSLGNMSYACVLDIAYSFLVPSLNLPDVIMIHQQSVLGKLLLSVSQWLIHCG